MKIPRPHKNFFWFETGKYDKDNYLSYYFNDPVEIIKLTDPAKMILFFEQIEKLSKEYYLAGFFSYELGYLFEDVFHYSRKNGFPYAVFHAYKKPLVIDHRREPDSLQQSNLKYKISHLKLNISKETYLKHIRKVRDYIYKGDIFQANYTVKYKFRFSGSPQALYNDLKRKQNVSYNVFARTGDYYILSLSPELFFAKNRRDIISKPMKGTVKRGRNNKEDEENRRFLCHDEKNKSENVMIVDLLRNDIGRVSEYGSVHVPKLWEVEKYDTLFQMTSTVKSRLQKGVSIYQLIKAIFPCGSITGAPKIRSMEIIRELEKEERNIYTGAIGFFQPNGKAKFNIAIRTVLLHKSKGEMGIGGGIVYDSRPAEEFRECELKASFLIKDPLPEFQLIETMLFNRKIQYLDFHMKRLKSSANYFDFLFPEKKIIEKLKKITKRLKGKWKVRLLLGKTGQLTLECSPLDVWSGEYRITISKIRIDNQNAFYFHKTTNRKLYNEELKKVRKSGYYDVIFLNKREEVTEGAITNIYIRKKDIIYTPPIECGLLNGTIRQAFLKKNKVRERVLKLKDLYSADGIYISNSIIGFQEAELK